MDMYELYTEGKSEAVDRIYVNFNKLFKKETEVPLTEITKNVEGSSDRIKELIKNGDLVDKLINKVYEEHGNEKDSVTGKPWNTATYRYAEKAKITYTKIGNRYVMYYICKTIVCVPFRAKENENNERYTSKTSAAAYLKRLLIDIKKQNTMDEMEFKIQSAEGSAQDIGLYATFKVILGKAKDEAKPKEKNVTEEVSIDISDNHVYDEPVSLESAIYGDTFTEAEDVNPELNSVNLEIKRLDELRAKVSDLQRNYDESEKEFMADSNPTNEKKMRGYGALLSKAEKELKDTEDNLNAKKDKLTAMESVILEGRRNISPEIKPIVDIFNKKRYKVKYASPGYSSERKKNDRDKDGVYYGKTYSTARVMFDGPYALPTAPDGWHIREVDGCTYLDVNPKSANKPSDKDLQERHDELLASLQKYAEDLEPYKSDKVSDTSEDTIGVAKESFDIDFDSFIESVDNVEINGDILKNEKAYTESMCSFIDSLDSVCP